MCSDVDGNSNSRSSLLGMDLANLIVTPELLGLNGVAAQSLAPDQLVAKHLFGSQWKGKRGAELDIAGIDHERTDIRLSNFPMHRAGVESEHRGTERLLGRRALVVGGASGLGEAATIALAAEGADVAFSFVASEEAQAKKVAEWIKATGRKGVALRGDLRSPASCKALHTNALKKLGSLDLLVNHIDPRTFQHGAISTRNGDFSASFKSAAYPMFWMTREALLHLPSDASIINATAVSAYDPSINLVDYAAVKAAVISFSKSLAAALRLRGIRIHAFVPGALWMPAHGTQQQSEAQNVAAPKIPVADWLQRPTDVSASFIELCCMTLTP